MRGCSAVYVALVFGLSCCCGCLVAVEAAAGSSAAAATAATAATTTTTTTTTRRIGVGPPLSDPSPSSSSSLLETSLESPRLLPLSKRARRTDIINEASPAWGAIKSGALRGGGRRRVGAAAPADAETTLTSSVSVSSVLVAPEGAPPPPPLGDGSSEEESLVPPPPPPEHGELDMCGRGLRLRNLFKSAATRMMVAGRRPRHEAGRRPRPRSSATKEAPPPALHHSHHHPDHRHHSSPCGRMADEFRHALVTDDDGPPLQKMTSRGNAAENNDDANKDGPSSSRIDVAKLLRAAEHYTAEMRRIGQKQSASDMERNVHKAMQLLKGSPVSVHHDLRALLEYEKSTGIHEPGGHIKDPSGAVGLLWIRRSLAYQHSMFDLVLNHRVRPPDAALQAYRHELQPYHGWALQKLYGLAMSSMTPGSTQELLAKVGGYKLPADGAGGGAESKSELSESHVADRRHGRRVKVGAGGAVTAMEREGSYQHIHQQHHHQHQHHQQQEQQHHHSQHHSTSPPDLAELESATRRDLQRLLDAWDPLLRRWKQVFHDLDLEDPRRY